MAFETTGDANMAARAAGKICDLIEARAPYRPQNEGRPEIAVKIIHVGVGSVEGAFYATPEQHGDT